MLLLGPLGFVTPWLLAAMRSMCREERKISCFQMTKPTRLRKPATATKMKKRARVSTR